MSIKKGSVRDAYNSIYTAFREDEELMRLLYYPPKDSKNLDPLDKRLPNITEMELGDYWDIVEERIRLAEKTSDLEDKPLCRIYISLGRRRPIFGNYMLVTQEVLVSVYTHEMFEKDSRNEWILDRINELLVSEKLQGMIGKVEYAGGDPYVAPAQYKNYRHRYRYTDSKK